MAVQVVVVLVVVMVVIRDLIWVRLSWATAVDSDHAHVHAGLRGVLLPARDLTVPDL